MTKQNQLMTGISHENTKLSRKNEKQEKGREKGHTLE